MEPAEFLRVARDLDAAGHEAEWRSSIGRSYYAVFNQVKIRVGTLKQLPTTDDVHALLVDYLTLSNNRELQSVGQTLNDLRISRNEADYDLHLAVDQSKSRTALLKAERAMQRYVNINDAHFTAAINAQPTRRKRHTV